MKVTELDNIGLIRSHLLKRELAKTGGDISILVHPFFDIAASLQYERHSSKYWLTKNHYR